MLQWRVAKFVGNMHGMLSVHDLKALDLNGLTPEAVTRLAQQMLHHIGQQAQEIERKAQEIQCKAQEIERKDRDIAWRDAKLQKITFELARLKRWKFGAKSEAMSQQQRQLFEDTLLEDEADLQAQLAALQAASTQAPAAAKAPAQRPRRQALPEHLRRVEHSHEPHSTTCPAPECGQPMVRIGQDVSERLDIVPAEFFVHRHVYGKWACKCCQVLVQEPAAPQIIDGGIPAPGLVAHTLISRFVDHLPYYRQEAINARSGVHTPRSTLAQWAGRAGAGLEPLYEAHKRFVLSCGVLHVDETPVAVLDPGAGKTKRAYVWAYARGALDATPGVIYEFCAGRGAQYPIKFLGPPLHAREGEHAWQGTLVRDEYSAYDSVVQPQAHTGRTAAGCAAHARRKFDELLKAQSSSIAPGALQRWADIYRIEGELVSMNCEQRLAKRQELTRPLWEQMHAWLKAQRNQVPEGSAGAKAIDYSLKNWAALTQHLRDGTVPMDNNHVERQIRPWAMGRRAWLFAGSELAGQRAAIVMSLLQSAKLNGHEPHAYLTDVIERLPAHPNQSIDELLPHRWKPG